ncbi:MAG: hypothetical protein Q8Q06_01250 [bacterium]|nr:hypothetical protein [bacterium]
MTHRKNTSVLGFDLDGVILDHTKNKVRLASKLGIKISADKTPSEIIKKHLPDKIYHNFQEILYDDPVISRSSPVMPGLKNTLAKIKASGLNFFLISRRRNPDKTVNLMKYHKIWPEYFNEKNTFFVDNKEDKDIRAKKLGITHYIDDEITVLNLLVSVQNKFLFDNLNVFKNSENYTRIRSWAEFNKILNKLT